jgi:hypothetical protein
MEMLITLSVTGKEGLDFSLAYKGTTQKTVDLVSGELKKTVKKMLHHDAHTDPKPAITEVVGDIVLPETKGDMNIVLALKVAETPANDFSLTYPKADMKTVLYVESILLALIAKINAE